MPQKGAVHEGALCYYGERTFGADGPGELRMMVRQGIGKPTLLDKANDVRDYADDFECGHTGYPVKQLALAILVDYVVRVLGHDREDAEQHVTLERVEQLTYVLLVNLPTDCSWTIQGHEIDKLNATHLHIPPKVAA